MPVAHGRLWDESCFLSAGEILTRLERDLGRLEPRPAADPSAPARLYAPAKAPGAIGFISAVSAHFCSGCNRLRLTADGKLKPCLLTDREINLREPLRTGASDQELRELFLAAAGHKPVSHLEAGPADSAGAERGMSRIGG